MSIMYYAFLGRIRDAMMLRRSALTGIMHHAALFCTSGELTRADVPSGWIGVRQLVMNAFGVDLPCRRLGGAHSPAAYGPDGMRPRATYRNSAASGQLVGSCTRIRARCSITRAPILIRRSRMVANSHFASGFAWGIAARTPCISQNAAVWRTSRT